MTKLILSCSMLFTTADGLACKLNDRYIRCESEFGACLQKFRFFATCYDGKNRQLTLAPNGRVSYLE